MLFNEFFNEYPYRDISSTNLDWLIKQLRKLEKELINFVSLNTITYADPIQWSITTQYKMNTVVVDPISKTAYISTKPVPIGVRISDTNYWTPIFDLNQLSSNQNITLREDGYNVLASFPSHVGDWLIWQDLLYKVKAEITTDSPYVVDYNIERYTVEMFLNDYTAEVIAQLNALAAKVGALTDLNTTDKNTIVAAINEILTRIGNEASARQNADATLQVNIDAEATARQNADNTLQGNINAEATARQNADNAILDKIGNMNNLHTQNKSTVVAAINEVFSDFNRYKGHWITPEDFGAVGDGVTDDTQAVQAAISDGRPVRFVNNYAVTTVHFTYGLSTRLLDGNDHYLHALDKTKTPVEFCGGGTLIYRLGIRQHGEIGEAPALYWYSENGGASNFNIFYDLRFDYCYHCIKYGDGSEVAQSENRIIGMFTYACSQFVTTHGRLLQLWIDQAVLNASQFPSSGNMPPMINVTRGSILFIDNSTIENVGYEQQGGIVSTGECYINNCVLEIAGINLACFREANGVDNDGLISLTNSRAYQGGVAKDFLDIAMGGNCVIENCYILKMSPANFFFYHNATSDTRITLQGVKCVGGLLPTGMFPNLELSINASTFDNCKMLNHGYFHLDNVCVPSPSAEAEIWDNTIYGNFEAYIANLQSSVYVGTTNNYLLLAGGAIGNSKGAFIYTAPNHKFGILRNYMAEYGSSIVGGVCFT